MTPRRHMPDASLLWFVQTNLQPEPQEELLATIQRHARLETFVGVPFQMEPPVLPAGFFFPVGTCNIIERIRAARPEVVQGELFDYRDYLRHLGELCLNADAWTGSLAELTLSRSDFPLFLRPVRDDKTFAGELWESFDRFERWREVVLSGATAIPVDCLVVAASPKRIREEWRLIVVEGRIATYSRYRKNGQPLRDRPELPEVISALADETIARWNPAPVFALDVAIDAEDARVIEIGSIHSCGLYACDREIFVRSVTTALGPRQ